MMTQSRVGDTMTTYRSDIDWPTERPPLHVHLKQQEKRILRVAAKATLSHPEWADDMAQELRLRAIRAWETWDPTKGPLSAHTWRYIQGSHLRFFHRQWTAPKGFRCRDDEPKTESLDVPLPSGDGTKADSVEGGIVNFDQVDAAYDARRVLPLVIEEITSNRQTPGVDVMIARLCAVENGDMADVAKQQNVSLEAVRASRQRLIANLHNRGIK